MPDARLEKTRATLPEGYQFGDAGNPYMAHMRVLGQHAAAIMGRAAFTHIEYGTCARCGRLGVLKPPDRQCEHCDNWQHTANVIEGDHH
jgi:hypothetical protein